MILSTVMSEGVTPSALEFLRAHPNLFKVAITNARARLIVVGDRQACLQGGVELLADFARYVAECEGRSGKRQAAPNSRSPFPPTPDPSRVSDGEDVFFKHFAKRASRPFPKSS